MGEDMGRSVEKEADQEQLDATARQVVARLVPGLGKVASRFVGDMVRGMLASVSVRLTRIAAGLAEPIALHATHKRISRNLAKRQTGLTVAANLLATGAELITPDALLVVDTFDLAKPYSRHMQYLGTAAGSSTDLAPASGSETPSSAGLPAYRVCEIFGWDSQAGPMPAFAAPADAPAADDPAPDIGAGNRLVVAPLAQALWSNRAPDYRGDAAEVLPLIDRVAEACGTRGVFALDAAHSEVLAALVGRPQARFLLRLPQQVELLRSGRLASAGEIARSCRTPYGITVYKRQGDFDEGMFIHFGFAAVRHPRHPERPLWLIVVRGLTGGEDRWDPLLVLTNEPMRRSRKVLWRPVWSFLHYWDAVLTNQQIRRRFDLEDVRVLGYDSLRNIGTLMQAAAFVAAQWPGAPLAQSMSLRPRDEVAVRFRGDPP